MRKVFMIIALSIIISMKSFANVPEILPDTSMVYPENHSISFLNMSSQCHYVCANYIGIEDTLNAERSKLIFAHNPSDSISYCNIRICKPSLIGFKNGGSFVSLLKDFRSLNYYMVFDTLTLYMNTYAYLSLFSDTSNNILGLDYGSARKDSQGEFISYLVDLTDNALDIPTSTKYEEVQIFSKPQGDSLAELYDETGLLIGLKYYSSVQNKTYVKYVQN